MKAGSKEDIALRSVALQNAQSILLARQRAERDLIQANDALERKSQELAHSLSVMQATLDSTWDGILVTDNDGRITGHNQTYFQMWRIPADATTLGDHRSLLKVVSSQFSDPASFIARVEEIYVAALPESFDLLELSDGRVFERFSKRLLVDERAAGRVWSFRDITQRRNVENALRDETRMLELLNRTGTTIAANLDLQALLQFVTDAATQLSGARCGGFFCKTTGEHGGPLLLRAFSGAVDESVEKFWREFAPAILNAAFNDATPIRCDDVLDHREHDVRQADHCLAPESLRMRSFLAVPVTSRLGEQIGGVFFSHPLPGVFTERTERLVVGVAAQAAIAIDNARLYETAQKAAEERRHLLDSERHARSHAERMSAMKDEFLATLSHELRTPLGAILGWSQVLRRTGGHGNDLQKGLEAIERNARMQTKLIEDLLDMSRITSGKVRLDIHPVQPVSFIEAAIETVRPAADAKKIEIEKLLDPFAGPISGDPNRLQQVVWNLLSNAIKFTPKDGKVGVVLERVNSHIEISVRDTGIGIDSEFLKHVFDRFRQADHSTTRRYGGLGLGLAIVKHLVEQHGGTVHASSEGEALGSTFTVLLPIAAVHRTTQHELGTQHAAPVDFTPLDLSGVKILVVDDEPDARILLERVLIECRADVFVAESAAAALRLIEAQKVDVLVSDIGMPDMDGYELLRRIRSLGESRGGQVPAVALTAFARTQDRTRAEQAGFQLHLSKPVEPAKLVASVASVVGRASPRE